MARVIVASCVFPPEPVVSARTSCDVADWLAASGHEVQVICPRPARGVSGASMVLDKPYPVVRFRTWQSRRSTLLSRLAENLSYGLHAFFHILFSRRVELIYANVWPLFSLGLVVLAARCRGIPVIASMQDLYPESLAAQGRLGRESLPYRWMLALDAWAAHGCAHLVVISESFRAAYRQRGVSERKLSLIKNWISSDGHPPLARDEARAVLREHGVELPGEGLVLVYGGNLGVASGLDACVEALAGLDGHLLVAGDGALLPTLREQADSAAWRGRMTILSPWPAELTAPVLGAADVLLLPLQDGQAQASIPSKMISYLLAARPVLLVSNVVGDTHDELFASGGGVASRMTAPELARALDELRALRPEQRDAMGLQGRGYALREYTFNAARERLGGIIHDIGL